jgi:hypothetical protein
MLGDILRELTDVAIAESILAAIGNPSVVEQVRRDAAAEGVAVATLVATRSAICLITLGREVWLDLLGRMSGSPQPGAAALEAMLARAFPDPVGARII